MGAAGAAAGEVDGGDGIPTVPEHQLVEPDEIRTSGAVGGSTWMLSVRLPVRDRSAQGIELGKLRSALGSRSTIRSIKGSTLGALRSGSAATLRSVRIKGSELVSCAVGRLTSSRKLL